MNKDRFDFSEIDAALPAAEKMQEEDRVADALENNYKAVGILNDKLEKLENRLSAALPGLDRAASSLHEANKITVSEEAKRTLEQEGDAICRKIADRIDKESAKLLDRLSMKDRVIISATAFWCMILTVIILSAFFACIIVANSYLFQSTILWEIIGCFTGLWMLCVAIIVFVCYKLK